MFKENDEVEIINDDTYRYTKKGMRGIVTYSDEKLTVVLVHDLNEPFMLMTSTLKLVRRKHDYRCFRRF